MFGKKKKSITIRIIIENQDFGQLSLQSGADYDGGMNTIRNGLDDRT